MRVEFSKRPTHEGIFGPEILINVESGVGCLRLADGKTAGFIPEPPRTNAFAVWLQRPIVVVSEGIDVTNASRVAAGLRQLLEQADLPIVFSLGRGVGSAHARAVADNAVPHIERELARAAAYTSVQAGFFEESEFRIELDGRLFSFSVAFRPVVGGTSWPHID
jgi:hypothetical protein